VGEVGERAKEVARRIVAAIVDNRAGTAVNPELMDICEPSPTIDEI
jgi:hypothetical protein